MNNLFLVLSVILIFYQQTNGYSNEENVKGSINFSFDLYRTLYNESENLVVSPYSLRILLGILYQSSYKSAESELSDKVYLGEKTTTLATQKFAIDKFVCSPNVKVANKLFVREGVTLRPDFRAVVTEYKSDIELVNFSETFKVTNNINQWVEEHTNGLIKNLVSSDMMTPDTALFIINTLYFKAKWENEFSIHSVHQNKFHGYDKDYMMDFMVESYDYRSIKTDEYKAEVVEIPYTKDSNFVFWIVLPFESSNIQELQSNLNYDSIQKIDFGMTSRYMDLYMPIFNIESAINGKEALKKMGIKTIFNSGEISILDSDALRLVVDDVRQKSKITVNTEGTEAASASLFKINAISARPLIIVNRPFIYMVMTADTKEPIFVGHIVKS